ncbi:MAG: diaminopimelate decarboxylase [Fusobacterium sp.]|nr:diaminopimelate decarboxylase [Fusobacterium sp.]
MKSSANQNLKPLTTRVNDNGNLEISGCDLVALAEKFSTPLYVLDENTLRTICRDYKEAFKPYPKTKLLFASKSLCTMATSKILAQEGFGFDVVSDGEMYTVHKADVDMKTVLFNGSNKGIDELNLALELGVGRISVDNFLELSLLNELASNKGKTVDILLRITPGIECHTHEYIQTGHLDSKFGFDLTQIDSAIELTLDEYKKLNIKGLHAHIGSQIFETKVYKDEVDILVGEMVRINKKFGLSLNELNLGGGLGVKYTNVDYPPSTYEIAGIIIDALNENIQKYGIEPPVIYLEPGRSIVCTSGVTLYTLGSSKQVPHGTKYIAIDGGMADNPRPAMYQAEYFAQIANKPDAELAQSVTIAGRFCESGDILIKNIKLPETQEGDILCVYNTGAYNYSMASNYNRVAKPAMVLVNNGNADIIIERETLEDITRNDRIPQRLGE